MVPALVMDAPATSLARDGPSSCSSHFSFVSYTTSSRMISCSSRKAAPPARAAWKYVFITALSGKKQSTTRPAQAGSMSAKQRVCSRPRRESGWRTPSMATHMTEKKRHVPRLKTMRAQKKHKSAVV